MHTRLTGLVFHVVIACDLVIQMVVPNAAMPPRPPSSPLKSSRRRRRRCGHLLNAVSKTGIIKATHIGCHRCHSVERHFSISDLFDIDFFRAVFSDKAAERCHPHQHFPTSNLKHDFHVRGF